MSNQKDNILTDIPWFLTTDGEKTVEEVLKNLRTVTLDTEVPGYIYGTQFRFLMTIFPLIVMEAMKEGLKADKYTETHVDSVLAKLSPYSHLLDAQNPFLQIPESLVTDRSDAIAVNKRPWKLMPAQPSESQQVFWNLEEKPKSLLETQEAVRLLVSCYFYRPGGNGGVSGRKPENGASALRYVDSAKTPPAVEIIPSSDTLLKTLLMVTPTEWVLPRNEHTLPHWADLEGATLYNPDRGNPSNLWLFSWTSNVAYCFWDSNMQLTKVGIGGVPESWKPGHLFTPLPGVPLKEAWKTVNNFRKQKDPLYFYSLDNHPKNPELKLKYMSLSSEPYYHIARWNSEHLSGELANKWALNLDGDLDNLENLILLEHSTGGTAQSFTIRHSKVVVGWKDELLPDPENTKVDEIYKSVLNVRKKLIGMFSDKGTMKHLASRQKEVERVFWGEMLEVVQRITDGEIAVSVAQKYTKEAAIKALNTVSSRRNTLNLKQHLKAENSLKGMKQ